MSTFRNAASLLRDSVRDPTLIRQVYRSAGRRLKSEQKAFGLRRDLTVEHTAPPSPIPLHVRRIRDADVPHVLGPDTSLSLEEKSERTDRLRLIEAGAGMAYCAVTDEDVPCYVQWIFTSADNAFLRDHFQGTFPELDEETALLEGAYIPPDFRGQRILSAAVEQVIDQARSMGARYVITFIGADNTPSLKGAARSGFEIYVERHTRWRMLRSTVEFRPLPASDVQEPGALV